MEIENRGTPRALRAAIEVYARWEAERDRSPLDRIIDAESRSRRALNAGERRWMSETVYGCVRFLRRQEFLLDRLQLPDTPEMRVRLWGSAPAAPDGTPLASEEQPLEIENPDSKIETALAALPGPDTPRDFLRVTLSFPDAMADELEALLGAEAVTAAKALNARAPMTLRVNTLRATPLRAQQALPGATLTRWSPWGLELPRRANLFDLPGFRAGWFEAQEEASQLAVQLTEARSGQTVVEVGAGAGGKTLALAAMMRNRGRIVAIDTAESRLEELRKRAKRAGVTIAEPLALDADALGHWQPALPTRRALNALRGAADVVLLDAPCTGSGTLRRSPDTKWRGANPADFARLQESLLAQASPLVKSGGVLVYITCAFERSQDEAVVASFLNAPAGQDFALEPIPAPLAPFATGSYFRTWPHRHGLDAFFGARLRRAV